MKVVGVFLACISLAFQYFSTSLEDYWFFPQYEKKKKINLDVLISKLELYLTVILKLSRPFNSFTCERSSLPGLSPCPLLPLFPPQFSQCFRSQTFLLISQSSISLMSFARSFINLSFPHLYSIFDTQFLDTIWRNEQCHKLKSSAVIVTVSAVASFWTKNILSSRASVGRHHWGTSTSPEISLG